MTVDGGPAAPPFRTGAPEILLLRPMSPLLERELEAVYRVHRLYPSGDDERILEIAGRSIRAVVTTGAAGLPPDLSSRLPALELIAVHGVGADRIDLAEISRRGVKVTFTHDVLTDDVADLAIGLWLAATRRIGEGDRYVRSGAWTSGRALPLARTASNRTVGILGLGRIGSAIAARARPFARSILYHSRRPVEGSPHAYVSSVEALAERSDVLFVAASGRADSPPIVGEAALDALGPEGVLINVARGSSVDEPALVRALAAGRIAAAGLDVFAGEPDVPPDLLSMENVVLQPHRGTATHETRAAMAQAVLKSLADHFAEMRAQA